MTEPRDNRLKPPQAQIDGECLICGKATAECKCPPVAVNTAMYFDHGFAAGIEAAAQRCDDRAKRWNAPDCLVENAGIENGEIRGNITYEGKSLGPAPLTVDARNLALGNASGRALASVNHHNTENRR